MHTGFRALLARYFDRRGVSHRAIARLLRIDRGTVKRLLGRPPSHPPSLVIVRKCPECGAYVRWPCRVCRLRKGLAHADH